MIDNFCLFPVGIKKIVTWRWDKFRAEISGRVYERYLVLVWYLVSIKDVGGFGQEHGIQKFQFVLGSSISCGGEKLWHGVHAKDGWRAIVDLLEWKLS